MLSQETTVHFALEMMKLAGLSCLPVIGEDGSLMGQFNHHK